MTPASKVRIDCNVRRESHILMVVRYFWWGHLFLEILVDNSQPKTALPLLAPRSNPKKIDIVPKVGSWIGFGYTEKNLSF